MPSDIAMTIGVHCTSLAKSSDSVSQHAIKLQCHGLHRDQSSIEG